MLVRLSGRSSVGADAAGSGLFSSVRVPVGSNSAVTPQPSAGAPRMRSGGHTSGPVGEALTLRPSRRSLSPQLASGEASVGPPPVGVGEGFAACQRRILRGLPPFSPGLG